MPAIAWTQPALDDLRSIDRWLTDNATPEIALVTLVEIRTRSHFLENFPRGGRPIGDGNRVLRVMGTRYLLLYRLIDDAVQILRIRHEREDWFVEP